MAREQSAKNEYAAADIESALGAANICVIGSATVGQSVIKSLNRAGARKIVLLSIGESEAKAKELTVAGDDFAKAGFCQQIDLQWTLTDIENYVSKADLIIDALTDWQKKLGLSDICMEFGKVLIHSGVNGFRFQIYTMIPGRSACLRCALPLAGIDEVRFKPTDESTIGAVIELVDAWQSLEAIKYLAKIGIMQGNELFKFDCLSGEFDVIRGLDANLDCPDCGRKLSKRMRRPKS